MSFNEPFPDYYSILQISENATDEEIREAYKREALRNHPDRNREDPDATRKFQLISDAYFILSDATRRSQYDQARRSQSHSSWARQSQDAPAADETFGNVFEEILKPEVENPKWLYTPLGSVAGGILGFICGSIPGALLGSFAGAKLGAVRDNKGVSVYEAFMKLPQTQKYAILQALAAKILK
ncbi:DnaJ-domain-containing protein [Basidiobolus meristosporus CBS 931.73]|uniref:DnaJ-domain-containing protein n=1 Tax=Basidiobolus meristosporus CBS 931.73 TaxID=1314790 RepID=A0A1Y1Y0N0_9FUNG|nr:DnaJ-domain-containing protein [Basidiobolus meristosporus CBS 931.73]|eukprot:ORX91561.1 DnaJ-domain-containing protein [Basidiobolus meristosporus CBS 931.73]